MPDSQEPKIEFFKGISEELSHVSLRRTKSTGERNVLFIFESLQALSIINSYTKGAADDMKLIDSEGEISVKPSAVRFIFGGDEGDELRRVECEFTIAREDYWERFMRFMNRYAEVNGMGYQDK
ncbi:MAG: photosystem II reaction center protein Psb28 [Jaaginema sp. PMC 1079.18]|nr:photosystem II reaction center protein Psb28 [Jaaginema sp. PMC 1080.18]MEC4850233.1 photosystem II reaction center protein Psb28 [Jaaginema sp. PMC 1079.18]MEC4867303.1 photosystem II reaction center protein Psb28 [Jaaginema sp. PMC 1078.18]